MALPSRVKRLAAAASPRRSGCPCSLPPIVNFAVGLLKEPALCSIIAAPELMLRAKHLASSSFLPMQAFVLAAVFYYA